MSLVSLSVLRSGAWNQRLGSSVRVRREPCGGRMVHRGGVVLQDALCCSPGLFQQVVAASQLPAFVSVCTGDEGDDGWAAFIR